MSGIKLNNNQKDFVTACHKNVLVSAGAGSGKTTTMIEKLRYLITEKKVPVKQLMVVTFTEKAALEMKHKLYTALQKDVANNPELLIEQLEDVATADIGTIHSVCKKLLTKYFYEANLDPNFTIIQGTEHASILTQAVNNVFAAEAAAENEDFFTLFESFNKKRTDKNLKEAVTKIYLYITEMTNAQEWMNHVLTNTFATNEAQNPVADYLVAYYKTTLHKYLPLFIKAKENCARYKLTNLQDYTGVIVNYLTAVQEAKDLQSFLQAVFAERTAGTLSLKKKDDAEAAEFFETLKLLVKQFKEDVDKARKNLVHNNTAEFMQNIAFNLAGVRKLFDLAVKVGKEFSALKENLCVLDFSDLQIKMLELLKQEKIKEEICRSYAYVFIDEYQDVNAIQENILTQIAGAGNLNMIGDIKQSIYEFRQCDPEIFLGKYKTYENSKTNKLINLNENYRSSPTILQFANFVFNEIITEETVGISYKRQAQLEAGNQELKENAELSGVEVHVLNTAENNESDNEEDDATNDEAEGEIIAKNIKEALSRTIYDITEKEEDKRVRLVDYKDIAVLTRDSGTLVYAIYNALKKYKIPVNVEFKKNIFESAEIKMLKAMVSVVSNFCNDLDVVTVLKSFIINCTDTELAEIKTNTAQKNFYNCVIDYYKSGTNEAITEKLQKFFLLINKFRFKLNSLTVYEIVQEILTENNAINYYYSFPDGAEKVNNIAEFLSVINNPAYEYNLTRCVEYLNELEAGGSFKQSVYSGDNAVQILTMHASKGLEFPVVFLAGLGKKFNTNVFRDEVSICKPFGLGVANRDIVLKKETPSVIKNACKLMINQTELSEQIRLLYVAITRARNYLFLSGSYNLNNMEINKSKSIYNSVCFYDLLFKAFKDKSNLVVYNNFIKKESETEKPLLFTGGNAQLVNNLQKNISYVYPGCEKQVSIKNTVSALLTENSDYEMFTPEPKAFTLNELVTYNSAAELGTLYHDIMSRLNYTETLQEINGLIYNVCTSGKYSEALTALINGEEILAAVTAVKALLQPGVKMLKEAQFIFRGIHNNLVKNSNNNSTILVQGVADLVLLFNNKAIVIDFKTNRNKTDQQLKEMYALQLDVYKKAVCSAFNVKQCDKYIYSFFNNRLISL